MADIPSALPVRSEADGADERVQVKIVDSTNPGTQQGVVDANNDFHVLAKGHDSGGASIPILVDATGQVFVIVSEAAGTEIADYKSATVLAAASDNHDYTVPATKTLQLRGIWATGSGKIKIEVLVGPLLTLVAKFAGFNSTATPNIWIPLANGVDIDVPAGDIVRVIVTNRDNQPQDVYSTILGQLQP